MGVFKDLFKRGEFIRIIIPRYIIECIFKVFINLLFSASAPNRALVKNETQQLYLISCWL